MSRLAGFVMVGVLIEALLFVFVQVSGRALRPRFAALVAVAAASWLVAGHLRQSASLPGRVVAQAVLISAGIRFLGWLSLGIGMPLAAPVAYLVGVPLALAVCAAFAAAQVYGGAWAARRIGRH